MAVSKRRQAMPDPGVGLPPHIQLAIEKHNGMGHRPAASPIERIVDQACGLTPEKAALNRGRLSLTLQCPACHKEIQVRPHWSDPEGTATVLAACLVCRPEHGDGGTYLDALGQPIDWEAQAAARTPETSHARRSGGA